MKPQPLTLKPLTEAVIIALAEMRGARPTNILFDSRYGILTL